MKRFPTTEIFTLCLAVVLTSLWTIPGICQEKSSAARGVSASSGRPSTIEIQQHYLLMKRAQIERDIKEAQRCLSDARQPTVLYDPQGNINRISQIDIVDCGRRLEQLQRELSNLARASNAMAKDANFQSSLLRRKYDIEQAKRRINMSNSIAQ